jgi:hypothetical protein
MPPPTSAGVLVPADSSLRSPRHRLLTFAVVCLNPGASRAHIGGTSRRLGAPLTSEHSATSPLDPQRHRPILVLDES